MAKPSYLQQLGDSLGFTVLPDALTFKGDFQHGKGIVLGLRSGYLVCVGLISAGEANSVGVIVRYRRGAPKDAIENALKSRPAFKSFIARKPVKVSADGLTVAWPYALKKPTPDAVRNFVDEVVSCVRGLAMPFGGKCEDCGSIEVAEITLVNAMPGYHCDACKARFAAEKERAAEEYKSRPANYMLGVPVGALIAAAAGTAWGLFISWAEVGSTTWSPKLHFIAGFFVAGPVGWAMFKTMGKVTRSGQVAAILLALAGKFWGDVIYYTFSVLYSSKAHLSINPFVWTQHDYQVFASFLRFVAAKFWQFKLYGFEGKFILVGDLACTFSLPLLPWAKLPKFDPTFERVGRLSETQARAAATGL